jgi:hypothetical protein
VGTLKQDLMRNRGRNADQVPRRKFLPDAALDCAIALFVGPYSLFIDQLAADKQGRRASLYKKNVDPGFMPFGRAVRLSAIQYRAVIRKVCLQLYGKKMRVSGGVLVHFLFVLLQRRCAPMLENRAMLPVPWPPAMESKLVAGNQIFFIARSS